MTFQPELFNPRLLNHELFNPMIQKFIVEKSGVEKFMVEKSGFERSGVEAWGSKVRGWDVLQPTDCTWKVKNCTLVIGLQYLHLWNFKLWNPNPLSALDFCNSPVWNIQFNELDFKSISNLNQAEKSSSNLEKLSSSSNSIFQTEEFQKSNADR